MISICWFTLQSQCTTRRMKEGVQVREEGHWQSCVCWEAGTGIAGDCRSGLKPIMKRRGNSLSSDPCSVQYNHFCPFVGSGNGDYYLLDFFFVLSLSLQLLPQSIGHLHQLEAVPQCSSILPVDTFARRQGWENGQCKRSRKLHLHKEGWGQGVAYPEQHGSCRGGCGGSESSLMCWDCSEGHTGCCHGLWILQMPSCPVVLRRGGIHCIWEYVQCRV